MISVAIRIWLAALISVGIVAGCAGQQQVREIPRSWAQTEAELGKLPVGRVVAIERQVYSKNGPNGVVVPNSVNPLMVAVIAPIMYGLRDGDWYYRHNIQLTISGEIIVRNEFATYKIGDCVAMREEPLMVVPAYPGACGSE